MKLFLLVTAALCLVVPKTVRADAFTNALIENTNSEGHSAQMEGVRGHCEPTAHLATGTPNTYLKQNPFGCNAAIVTFFRDNDQHVMVTFADTASTTHVISFAGRLERDGIMMHVSVVYFAPGRQTYVDEGGCKFFMKGRDVNQIFCFGKIDADGLRTVAIIPYQADTNQ